MNAEASQKPEHTHLEPGTEIGQYRIQDFVGEGGMGTVYRAQQQRLNRDVALKILPSELAEDEEFVRRFEREAEVLARLKHPNIVVIHDLHRIQEYVFLVMEYVEGNDLRTLMNEDQLSLEQALSIIPKLCDAIEYAHHQDVVHRDLKPENILIDGNGTPKITDFGLAKILAGRTNLTRTNVSMGTETYMAPEQRDAADVDRRADVYSLGVMTYELLTGTVPVGKYTPASELAPLDDELDEVIDRCLEPSPEDRFQQIGNLRTALSSALPEEHLTTAGVIEILGAAWDTFRRNSVRLTLLTIVAVVVSLVSLATMTGYMYGGLAYICLEALRNQENRPRYPDLFPSLSLFLPLTSLFLIQVIVVALGLASGVIPGLVLAVMWMFGVFFTIDDRTWPIESLSNSWKLTARIGFWKCSVLFTIAVLLYLLPSFLLVGVGQPPKGLTGGVRLVSCLPFVLPGLLIVSAAYEHARSV